jgi:anaerobic ribonucleoside-triphosphate reductase
MKCVVCGVEIMREYFQANVDVECKECSDGVVVCCNPDCRSKFEDGLDYFGKPVEHHSRITGYYGRVDNFNKGKLQEMRDRRRYGGKELSLP